MKKFILKFLALIFCVGPALGHAQSRPGYEDLPEIELTDLRDHRNKRITMFYAIGTRGLITTEDQQLTLREMKVVLGPEEVKNKPSIVFPKVSIRRQGFAPTYNFLVIVVHRQKDFYWKNAEGDWAKDPRLDEEEGETPPANSHVFDQVYSFSRIELRRMIQQQGNPPRIQISLKKDR